MQQTTNTILMVRPVSFRMNEQTAVNNYYQEDIDLLPATVNAKAQKEFDNYVEKLKAVGIHVIVVNDTNEYDTPDSVFPNNWVSFHENGDVGLYPMFAENRRLERREDILDKLEVEGFKINNVIDYTSAEEEDVFLEFCEDFEYFPVVFTANQTVDGQRKAIYHTNVMMSIAETFAVICLSSIDDKKERKNVISHLKADGKEIIDITETQVANFAGNMLQVKAANNERYLIMSEAAYNSLTKAQISTLEKHTKILSSSLHTIETCGGGSARCMMAEIFLPKG